MVQKPANESLLAAMLAKQMEFGLAPAAVCSDAGNPANANKKFENLL